MSASLILDGRSRRLRRRLGPVAWMLLEEAALSAEASGSADSLWSPLSVRRAADSLGIGREAAARALALLASEGLLRRPGSCRGAAGRFVPGGYLLVAPPGLLVTGLSGAASSADRRRGEPCPAVPATVARDEDSGKKVAVRRSARRGRPQPLPTGQASLFADVAGHREEIVGAGDAPRVAVESGVAVSSLGCEVDNRVHELAPGVRAGADPSFDPHPVKGGDAGC